MKKKTSLFWLLFIFITPCLASKSRPWTYSEKEYPEIEVTQFPIRVSKKSKTGRIYLFEDLEKRDPSPGQILLIKDSENKKIMAFQILKKDSFKNTFIAKRIKFYGSQRILEQGKEFLAYFKKRDFLKELPSLREIAREKTFDPDLDDIQLPAFEDNATLKTSTEPPKKQPTPSSDTDQENEMNDKPEVLEETTIIDPLTHWITGGFGFINNRSASGDSQSFSAGIFRYGHRIFNHIFFQFQSLQDSLVLEGGFALYKALDYGALGDAYSLISLLGTLRYNLLFNERIGIFFYGGTLKNTVTSSSQTQRNTISQLNSILPAAGGGLLIQLGPSWHSRIDIGIDYIGLGLVLRF